MLGVFFFPFLSIPTSQACNIYIKESHPWLNLNKNPEYQDWEKHQRMLKILTEAEMDT